MIKVNIWDLSNGTAVRRHFTSVFLITKVLKKLNLQNKYDGIRKWNVFTWSVLWFPVFSSLEEETSVGSSDD